MKPVIKLTLIKPVMKVTGFDVNENVGGLWTNSDGSQIQYGQKFQLSLLHLIKLFFLLLLQLGEKRLMTYLF